MGKISKKINEIDHMIGPDHGLTKEQMAIIGEYWLTNIDVASTESKKFVVDAAFVTLLPTPTQLVDRITETVIKKSPKKKHVVAKTINRICKFDPAVFAESVIIGRINKKNYSDIDEKVVNSTKLSDIFNFTEFEMKDVTETSDETKEIVFGASEDVANAKDVTETDEKSDSK